MDSLNHLVLKMAVRLMEIKVKELDRQIQNVGNLPMSADAIAKLEAIRRDISQRIPLIKAGIEDNDQDQMQADCRMLAELDLF